MLVQARRVRISTPNLNSRLRPLAVHPFFTKKRAPAGDPATSSPTGFTWLTPVGGTCLHATNLIPEARTKVAALDLDGTIIHGGGFNTGLNWKWWAPIVPKKLRELHEEGCVAHYFPSGFL